MYQGLVDEDIQPIDKLKDIVKGSIELEIGAPNDEHDLIAALAGKDVVFATSRLPLTRNVLESTDLAVVAKIGTGVDSVDLDAAEELGIPVTHTPGANALAVAEHTLCLVLTVAGRVSAGQDALREGGWRDELPVGSLVSNKTIGIVGFGNIGSRVGMLLSGFHVDILTYDPYIQEIDTEYAGATLTSLDELLEESDIITINSELTPETRKLISDREFDLIKPGAIIVNTARGPIIDEAALSKALASGKLAGAGLDVFEQEPLPADSPLHDFDNVVTTPHIAGVRAESRARTSTQIAKNALTLLSGETLPDRYLATPS